MRLWTTYLSLFGWVLREAVYEYVLQMCWLIKHMLEYIYEMHQSSSTDEHTYLQHITIWKKILYRVLLY